MKLFHTVYWPIGQLFHSYSCTYEQKEFLNWLLESRSNEHIDILMIIGDVFDLSRPSAASVKIFYSPLSHPIETNSGLQIITNAGNQESTSCLESPKLLLGSPNIHRIDLIEKKRKDLLLFDYYENALNREQYQNLIEHNLQPYIGKGYRYQKNSEDKVYPFKRLWQNQKCYSKC